MQAWDSCTLLPTSVDATRSKSQSDEMMMMYRYFWDKSSQRGACENESVPTKHPILKREIRTWAVDPCAQLFGDDEEDTATGRGAQEEEEEDREREIRRGARERERPTD